MKNFIIIILFVLTTTSSFSQNNFSISDSITYEKDPNWNFSLNYGFGFRIGKAPSGISKEQFEYIKDLKSGSSYNIKVSRQLDDTSFIGLEFSQFNSQGNLRNQSFTAPNGYSGTGTISDDIQISFYAIGAGLNYEGFGNKDIVLFEAYMGYLSFKDDIKLDTQKYVLTSGTLGIEISSSYFIGITDAFKIGPTVSLNGGVLNNYKITGPNGFYDSIRLENESRENLYRFDFMLGTLFRF